MHVGVVVFALVPYVSPAHAELIQNMELDKNQDTTMTSIVAISSASLTTHRFNFFDRILTDLRSQQPLLPMHNPCAQIEINRTNGDPEKR